MPPSSPSPGRRVIDQLHDIFGKRVGVRRRRASEGPHRHLVGPWSPSQPEVDPPWMQRLKSPELLGDHKWSMVGQHHTAGADAKGRRRVGQVRNQHRGCGTRHRWACRDARLPRAGGIRVAPPRMPFSPSRSGLGRGSTRRPRWQGRARKEEPCMVKHRSSLNASWPTLSRSRTRTRTLNSTSLMGSASNQAF